MRMSLNVFQKHEFSTQNFKTRFLIIKAYEKITCDVCATSKSMRYI